MILRKISPNPADRDLRSDAAFQTEMAEAEKMIADYPNDGAGFLCRGLLYQEEGLYKEALSDLNEAVRLAPDNAKARAARGMVLLSLDWNTNREKALCDYAAAMNLLSGKYPVRLQQRDDDEKSPAELKKIVDLATRDIRTKKDEYNAFIRRARANHELGQYNKSNRDFNKAMLLDPKNPEALLVRAELSWTERNDAGIISDVEAAFKLDPSRPEGYAALARHYCYVEDGHEALALAAADKSIDIRADFAPAHFYRAETLNHMKNLPEAIISYRQSVTLDPTFALAHWSLAECLEDEGLIDEAIVEFERFIAEADKVYVMGIIMAIADLEELKSAKN